jgi:hypothetical protein
MNGSWRSSTVSSEWSTLRRGPQEPPHEPHGDCMAYGCPRTGTAVTDDLTLCGYHRGAEAVRARHKTPGPRSEQ